jgi:hypothetical protein
MEAGGQRHADMICQHMPEAADREASSVGALHGAHFSITTSGLLFSTM